jgi:type II pantothenate kinase
MSPDHTHSDTAIAIGDDADHHEGNPQPRAMTNTTTTTAEIDSTISHPGSVRINVQGAFIVDGTEQPNTPANGYANTNGSYHEGKDIRLPNHTAVVSHVAVDVSLAPDGGSTMESRASRISDEG